MALKKGRDNEQNQSGYQNDDNELFQSAFSDYTDMLQEAVLAEARGFIQASDNTVLVGRGVKGHYQRRKDFL